jgi:hypothetical protein
MKKNPLMLTTLALALLAGCHEMEKSARRDDFPTEGPDRSYRRFADAHEAAGARHDGMLYAYHFDGDHLNSLGEHKLSSMLQTNDHALPLVVYLNTSEDGHLVARKEAVTTYLADAGLKDQQVHLEYGPNPNATSSAAANMSRLSKTESESGVASNPTNSSATGYGTGGSTATTGSDSSPK